MLFALCLLNGNEGTVLLFYVVFRYFFCNNYSIITFGCVFSLILFVVVCILWRKDVRCFSF